MSNIYNPVEVWVRYGVSDLYFGFINQANAVFRYGTFFYIMAAEKHLKALLLYERKSEYENISNIDSKRKKVDDIARRYSHKFDKMIEDAANIYQSRLEKEFMPTEYLGFSKDDLIKAMYEGYMETRYPSALSVSRLFPVKTAKGMYHAPLGSSFFTDFTRLICKRCWEYLVDQKTLNTESVLASIDEQYSKSIDYEAFYKEYLSSLA